MAGVSLHFVGAGSFAETNANAAVDVIFVHGLGGDATQTWSATGEPADFWPRWLAQELPTANIWSAGYDSSPLTSASSGGGLSLQIRSSSLLDYFLSNKIGQRPLIFVTHSLGGLLVKQILRKCADSLKPECKALLVTTRAVVFCATPHQGTKLASSICSILSVVASTHVKELVENAENLLDLNEWFRNWCVVSGAKVNAYHETKKTKGLWIVDAATANPNVSGCDPVGIDADHISISKPLTHDAPLYVSVKSLISSILEVNSVTLKPSALSGTETVMPYSGGRLLTPSGVAQLDPLGATHQQPVGMPLPDEEIPTHEILPEVLIDYQYFTTAAPYDRRSLSEKLEAADRALEKRDAERMKERFAMSLYRNASQASSLTRYTRLMSDVESRFKRHVWPLISDEKDEALVNAAVQASVISPVLATQLLETEDVTASLVESALYYLTGNCHVRWDPDKT
jgi:protein SERAC1